MSQGLTAQAPQDRSRWLVLVILSLALFLIVVDMTVLYTALPRLTHDLGASASEKLWIVNAYSLVMAGLLPGAGTLGDRLGPRRLLLAGLVVFGVASGWAALATSPGSLIAARVLLAVGAAMMMPATLAIIRHCFEDEHERAVAIGIWASVASGGAALGPLIGGALLEHFWWGSVFLINVPLVLIGLPLALWLIPKRPGLASQHWDLLGSLQIMVTLVALAFAIKESGSRTASEVAIALALLVSVLFAALFVRRQQRAVEPLIDFSLFRNRRFSSGVVTAVTAAIALIGTKLVYVQWLQLVDARSPLQAAYVIVPIPIAAFMAGPLAGWAMKWCDAGRMMAGAMLAAALGCVGVWHSYAEAGSLTLILSLALMGCALGVAITAASSAIMMNAPEQRAGMAASIEEVSYELGGALGVAWLGSVMTAVYGAALVLPNDVAWVPAVRDSLDEALMVAEQLPLELAGVLTTQAQLAFGQALETVLLSVAAVLAGVGLAVAWAARGAYRSH